MFVDAILLFAFASAFCPFIAVMARVVGDIKVKIADIPYRASFSSVFDTKPEVRWVRCCVCSQCLAPMMMMLHASTMSTNNAAAASVSTHWFLSVTMHHWCN